MHVTNNSGKSFRLVAAYALCTVGQPDIFRSLQNFWGTSHTLVLFGHFNTIFDASVNYVGSTCVTKGNSCHDDLHNHFQQADRYRLEFSNITVWTWSNSNGSSRSYLDWIIVRKLDKDIVRSSYFYHIYYTDHNFVTCRLDLNRLRLQESNYWKLNKSFFDCEEYRSKIRQLVLKALIGILINNK